MIRRPSCWPVLLAAVVLTGTTGISGIPNTPDIRPSSGFAQTPAPATPPAPANSDIVIIPPERRNIPGQRLTLSLGQLFIPDRFRAPAGGKIDLVIFFHGASWVAEQCFYSAKLNSVLYSISLKDYQKPFEKETSLQDAVEEVTAALRSNIHGGILRIDRICLASFSGGYVAVREILKNEGSYARITDLVLADSLYCAYEDPQTRLRLREDQLAVFLKFAEDAAKGKKRMWYTHLYPPEEKYRDNTTTRTASYLIDRLKGVRVAQNKTNSLGMLLLYSCDVGDFHVRGYSGMTHQDHFNHFYNLAEYMEMISFADKKHLPARQ